GDGTHPLLFFLSVLTQTSFVLAFIFSTVSWCLLSSATRRFHSSSVISASASADSPTAASLPPQVIAVQTQLPHAQTQR
uniref:Uncharacterized protein n=1 Tax=Poecilia formosa TaxID=48698 RepID=A0A087XPJ5_POEFO